VGDEKTNELAKARAKAKAKQRLEQISSGDLTRGLGGPAKSKSTISEMVETVNKAKTTKPSSSATTKKSATATTSKSTTKSSSKTENAKKDLLNKEEQLTKEKNKNLVKEIQSVDVISVNAARGKERRNKMIISLLSVSIVIVWAVIIILSALKSDKTNHNFYVYLSGDKSSSCEILLNDKPRTDWHVEKGITAGKNYVDEISINYTGSGEITVKFRVEVYRFTSEIKSFGRIETGDGFRIKREGNKIWYQKTVSNPGEIVLLTQISFVNSGQPEMRDLTSDNINIKMYVVVS